MIVRTADGVLILPRGASGILHTPTIQPVVQSLIAKGFRKPGDVENRLTYCLGDHALGTRLPHAHYLQESPLASAGHVFAMSTESRLEAPNEHRSTN